MSIIIHTIELNDMPIMFPHLHNRAPFNDKYTATFIINKKNTDIINYLLENINSILNYKPVLSKIKKKAKIIPFLKDGNDKKDTIGFKNHYYFIATSPIKPSISPIDLKTIYPGCRVNVRIKLTAHEAILRKQHSIYVSAQLLSIKFAKHDLTIYNEIIEKYHKGEYSPL